MIEQSRPEVSVKDRIASEFTKRIRKLRWMGLDAEAEQLQCALHAIRVDGVCANDPGATD